MHPAPELKILMVCLGNICRSPMAEGILRKKVNDRNLKITVDSAGTGGWHAGEHPDRRAIRTAKKFGVDISNLVARQFSWRDFDSFDLIFVMDRSNLEDVLATARTEDDVRKVRLLLDVEGNRGLKEVPDPWYGGEEGFTDVFHMMDKACDAIVQTLTQRAE